MSTRREIELAIVAGRVDRLLSLAGRAKGIAERRFLLDALTRALLLADPGTVTPAQRSLAESLRVDPYALSASTLEVPPHAVRVPLVANESVGFVRLLYLGFDAGGGGTGLSRSALLALREALAVASTITPPPYEADRFYLTAAQPAALSQLFIDGDSLGAAIVCSAVALWSKRELLPGLAITGAVRGAAIAPVGHIEAKVKGAVARADVERLIVPEANLEEARAVLEGSRRRRSLALLGARTVRDLLAHALVPRARSSRSAEAEVEAARKTFARGWQGYRWPEIRERFERLAAELPARRLDLRVEALARLAAAERHLGDPEASRQILGRALSLVETTEGQASVPDAPLTYLHQQLSMSEKQLGHLTAAARAAEKAARIARSARLRGELIKALGCVGLVALSRDRPQEAIDSFAESLEVVLAHDPKNVARTRAYLIEAYGRSGLTEAVTEELRLAMEEVQARPDPARRRSDEAWVRTAWASALHSLGRPEEAARALDVEVVRRAIEQSPLPGLLARRHLGRAYAEGEDAELAERGYEMLAASTVVYGHGLSPHLRFLAHTNVLFEARARLARGHWDQDIAARARQALAALPQHGDAPRLFGAPVRALTKQLGSRKRPRSTQAFDRLLERCLRLS